eukprot:3974111-Amphidinium_carterae.1
MSRSRKLPTTMSPTLFAPNLCAQYLLRSCGHTLFLNDMCHHPSHPSLTNRQLNLVTAHAEGIQWHCPCRPRATYRHCRKTSSTNDVVYKCQTMVSRSIWSTSHQTPAVNAGAQAHD